MHDVNWERFGVWDVGSRLRDTVFGSTKFGEVSGFAVHVNGEGELEKLAIARYETAQTERDGPFVVVVDVFGKDANKLISNQKRVVDVGLDRGLIFLKFVGGGSLFVINTLLEIEITNAGRKKVTSGKFYARLLTFPGRSKHLIVSENVLATNEEGFILAPSIKFSQESNHILLYGGSNEIQGAGPFVCLFAPVLDTSKPDAPSSKKSLSNNSSEISSVQSATPTAKINVVTKNWWQKIVQHRFTKKIAPWAFGALVVTTAWLLLKRYKK